MPCAGHRAAGSEGNSSGILINIDAEKQAARALQDRAERGPLTKLLNKDAGRRQAEEYFSRFPAGVDSALLSVVILPGSPVPWWLDFAGSLIAAVYLIYCGVQTIAESMRREK